MTHYDHDTLSRYGLDPALVDDPAAVAAHLAECDACRGYFETVKQMDAAARDVDMWEEVDHLLDTSDRDSESSKTMDAIVAEEAEARRRLEARLRSPLRFRAAVVTTNPKLRTAAVVRVLCAEANTLHEKRPLFSVEVAEAAFEIARSLPEEPESRRRFSMALALRERANAQRYLGRFKDALESLEDAEKLFDQTPGADAHDVAIVQLIRATIFMKSERLEEAIAESRKCLPTFRDYVDHLRELSTLMVQAACSYLAGANKDAVELYEQVIARAREYEDVSILAYSLSNAATCYAELSRFDTAEQHYLEAIVLYEELGISVQKARTAWAHASVMVKRGNLVPGEQRLDAARRELSRLGLQNDHALATLEWAEVRLVRGEVAGVAAACREIMLRFESEGMMKNARLALAYVHEGLAHGGATPSLVRHVRLYLEALPSRPDEVFVPLQ